MAKKKAKKTKKAKTAPGTKGTKIKCPVCECVVLVALPKQECVSFCPCPSCKETIEAHECCILCDFGQKPCGACKKR
ncbi:MAG TPA: hypothetical protein VIJ14_05315 [Rhabdochlamydiaceae bacterium]